MGRKIFTIVLFAVMMFVLGVTVATADWVEFPELENLPSVSSIFAPIAFSSPEEIPQAVEPTGTLYVFSTSAKTTGKAGGRVAMHAKCSSEDTKAHFCTNYEIQNAKLRNGVYIASSTTEESWIDWLDYKETTGLYDWSFFNCKSWTYSAYPDEGITLNINAYDFSGEYCENSLPIACCKWVP